MRSSGFLTGFFVQTALLRVPEGIVRPLCDLRRTTGEYYSTWGSCGRHFGAPFFGDFFRSLLKWIKFGVQHQFAFYPPPHCMFVSRYWQAPSHTALLKMFSLLDSNIASLLDLEWNPDLMFVIHSASHPRGCSICERINYPFVSQRSFTNYTLADWFLRFSVEGLTL